MVWCTHGLWVLFFGVRCLISSVLPPFSPMIIQPQFLLGQGGCECGKTRPSSGATVTQKVNLMLDFWYPDGWVTHQGTSTPLFPTSEITGKTVLSEGITALKSKQGKDSLVFLQKVKHRITVRPSYSTPRYIPLQAENVFKQKLVHEYS